MSNEEQKNFDLENDPVRSLLSGLIRVEAPGDFDFHVKARIASGRPVDRAASWLPATARLVVPLALLLVIGGFFGYNALYPTNNVAVAPVVEMQSVIPVPDVKPPAPVSAPPNDVVAKVNEIKPAVTDRIVTAKPTEKRIMLGRQSHTEPGGGSKEFSSGISKSLTRKDPDPNGKGSSNNIEIDTGASAKDILSVMGIVADSSWKIGLVRPNSRAARSGLKAGDLIEAIDGQNLTEKSTFENKSAGKSVRVRRGGTSVQIDLKH